MSESYTLGAASVAGQTSIQWSPGNIVIRTPTEGTRDEINSIAAACEAIGLPYTITPLEGPCARIESVITGTTSPTEDPVTEEFKFNTKGSVVPVEEHPTYVTNLQALITGWATIDESNVQLGLRTLADYHAGTDTADLDAGKLADIQDAGNGLIPFSRMILSGTKSYLRPDTAIVLIQKYQATAVFYPDQAGVGVVYTNSQLITALGIPTGISAKMKDGEWLCEEVDLDFQSDGTKVVTQTFRYSLTWDTDIYEHAP